MKVDEWGSLLQGHPWPPNQITAIYPNACRGLSRPNSLVAHKAIVGDHPQSSYKLARGRWADTIVHCAKQEINSILRSDVWAANYCVVFLSQRHIFWWPDRTWLMSILMVPEISCRAKQIFQQLWLNLNNALRAIWQGKCTPVPPVFEHQGWQAHTVGGPEAVSQYRSFNVVLWTDILPQTDDRYTT